MRKISNILVSKIREWQMHLSCITRDFFIFTGDFSIFCCVLYLKLFWWNEHSILCFQIICDIAASQFIDFWQYFLFSVSCRLFYIFENISHGCFTDKLGELIIILKKTQWICSTIKYLKEVDEKTCVIIKNTYKY